MALFILSYNFSFSFYHIHIAVAYLRWCLFRVLDDALRGAALKSVQPTVAAGYSVFCSCALLIQQRFQRCAMDCADEAKDTIPPGAKEGDAAVERAVAQVSRTPPPYRAVSNQSQEEEEEEEETERILVLVCIVTVSCLSNKMPVLLYLLCVPEV